MSTENGIDIIALARQAKEAGFDTPERIVARLEKIITRNNAYTARRRSRGRSTGFDDLVEEDTLALAAAIVLIESLAAPLENSEGQ